MFDVVWGEKVMMNTSSRYYTVQPNFSASLNFHRDGLIFRLNNEMATGNYVDTILTG